MTIKSIFNNVANQTTVTVRELIFVDNGKPQFKDTVLTYGNIDAFDSYNVGCIVPTGKYEMMIEIA